MSRPGPTALPARKPQMSPVTTTGALSPARSPHGAISRGWPHIPMTPNFNCPVSDAEIRHGTNWNCLIKFIFLQGRVVEIGGMEQKIFNKRRCGARDQPGAGVKGGRYHLPRIPVSIGGFGQALIHRGVTGKPAQDVGGFWSSFIDPRHRGRSFHPIMGRFDRQPDGVGGG